MKYSGKPTWHQEQVIQQIHLNSHSSSLWYLVWTSAGYLPMFIYLNGMSYCHVICWLDICANEQFISWLYVNARNWLNKDFLKQKMQNMFDIFDIIKLETKIGSTCYVFVNCIKGERMVSICMVPTVKHGWGGVKVWGCLAADTIGDLFITESTLNQHDYHSILQRHAIPSC